MELQPIDGPIEGYALDPESLEDCGVPIGEIVTFINAERASQGLPPAKSILVMGSEKPYRTFDL
mgnify:FL=1